MTGPRRVFAVDANPRQNALLELKIAGIRALEFEDFFAIFGKGWHGEFNLLYRACLRPQLSPYAQTFWDRNQNWFTAPGGRNTFYHYGLSGFVARAFRTYLSLRPRLRDGLHQLVLARNLDDQRNIYEDHVAPAMWTRPFKWALGRQFTMSLLGVPHPQRKEVQNQHPGGVPGFIREAIEFVVRDLPIWTNYFWMVYLQGQYTQDNCPEYLKRENFGALKSGLVDRISVSTETVTQFLQRTEERISRFVLLDHMDWMSTYHPAALNEEWDAILDRATDDARLIFRSAHASPSYLDSVRVGQGTNRRPVTESLRFHRELAQDLQQQDRVHTYAGFHIADVLT